MPEENASQKFKLKNVDEARKYLTEEMNQNELTIQMHKKVYRDFDYIEHFYSY